MIVMYHGNLVRLRKLRTEDASVILRHWNEYALRQYLPSPLPSGHKDLVKFIESANEAYEKRSKFTFGIEALDESRLIGFIDLADISWMSRFAEISQFAIFDPVYRGRGFGRDAMQVTLDFAFSVIDLHSVYLWVEEFNTKAVSFYEKFGFKTGGKIRELVYRNGSRHDVLIMDILKSEFMERYGVLPK